MIKRMLTPLIAKSLERGKSVLLLGARQTGKTTLIHRCFTPDLTLNFVEPKQRQLYEKDSQRLIETLKAFHQKLGRKPLVFLDEVQKVPMLMDAIQFLIDQDIAQFILTGSSARKLRYGTQINWLPGRLVVLTLDALSLGELESPPPIETLLRFGSLPGIHLCDDESLKDMDLHSYVSTYLEDEIRAEAWVRQLGPFARFLELAASESGELINFTRLSQDIGVADTTIAHYLELLQDCLIIERIDPIKQTHKRRLVRSAKFVFFDAGVRRACANESPQVTERALGKRFEQWIGMELIKMLRGHLPRIHVRHWRTSTGMEVDYVLEGPDTLIPIDVKWTANPQANDIKHVLKFMHDYGIGHGFLICRTPHPFAIHPQVMALPWQQLNTFVNN